MTARNIVALGIAAPVCAVSDCGQAVDYVGDVCSACEEAFYADLDTWTKSMELWHRLEVVGRTLLYTQPQRLAEIVAALEQEVARDV